VAASSQTTSITYADLETPASVGPTVTYPLGLPGDATSALVIATAAAFSSTGSAHAFMSVQVTGGSPTQTVPADANALEVSDNAEIRASATMVLTGLPANTPLTFTAKYRVTANTGTFANRDLTVVPLPGPVIRDGD
jgi:hypothetical protein